MKIVTFAPIDASNFSAGLGTIEAARLLSTDYEANSYRWQACDPETGAPLSPAVFGTPAPEGVNAAEVAADDHIRADIERTLPS